MPPQTGCEEEEAVPSGSVLIVHSASDAFLSAPTIILPVPSTHEHTTQLTIHSARNQSSKYHQIAKRNIHPTKCTKKINTQPNKRSSIQACTYHPKTLSKPAKSIHHNLANLFISRQSSVLSRQNACFHAHVRAV